MPFRIKEIRESKGMTQTELAEKAGVTRTTIWKLETGDEEITTSRTLLGIANALGVSIGDLFFKAEV